MPLPTPPPKPPDRHYDFGTMNLVFALSALALLVVTVVMVFFDYSKQWKRIQAEFRDLERQQVRQQMEAERERLDSEEIAQVRQDIAQARQELDVHRGDLEKLEKELARWEAEVYEADSRARQTKSYLDTAKYRYDATLQQGDAQEIAQSRSEYRELRKQLREEQKTLEELQQKRDETRELLEAKRAQLTESEKRLGALQQGLSNLRQRLADLEKDLDYFILNAPLMDVLDPTLKIEQVMLSGLFHDINFTNIDRVDRCLTCHVAAAQPGYDGDDWPQPYRSHPRLDLFVGDGSPHPYSRYGCTICHAGLDRATDFARAGHSPRSAEEKQEWVKRWDWERQQYLETPILPAPLSEAGCISCHATEVWTPESEQQQVGQELMLHFGCYGCHKIDYPAHTGLRRSGPDLTRVASKTNPGWAYRWIEAPRQFRPTTWMPHFFYQANIKGEENEKRQQAEILAIVDYLWERSGKPEYAPAPPGDPTRGRALFETVGCTGCHIMDAEASRDDFYPQIHRLHGPNLIRAGSKVSSDWLYAWLKNPRQYWAETNMPNLRLSDREAADLTAYLMSSRDPAYEDLALPEADPEIRDELVLGYLRNQLTIAQSQATLEGMDEHERNVYLGQETILKYGCFSCHNIAGFEDAKPIGTELTQEGSKPLHQFDFGHAHEVPHTRHDWIRTKLLQPRIYDRGKEEVKDYHELYKMPNFGMSEREADAVLSNVLGFTRESVVASRKAGQSSATAALAAGRKLVTRYNCQGCHLIEGTGQGIRTAIEDPGMLPPNLAAEGARVQSDWLFDFLHDPARVQLRPWLTVRMPTFGFTDDEANRLVAYFAALDGRQAFQSEFEPADARQVAVGGVIFDMFQCARCHPAGSAAARAIGARPAELAPSLLLAHERLRYDWVPLWIQDPQGWIPGTKMPTNFPPGPDGTPDSSVLATVVDTPRYSGEKRRMLRHFESEEALKAYLSDVEKVTEALRDYIWILGM